MSWQERLREAAYTTPSGVRLLFLYEDVSNEFSKKTSAFDFPDADGTFVQDNGRTSRRVPLRIFLSGNDYDLEANTFIDGLSENGTGVLEHPVYGTINVVPFGTINRRDNLKTGGNQAIIEVTFWETIDILFPSSQADPASVVLASVEEYNIAVSGQFEELIDTDTAVEKASFKNVYQNVLDTAEAGLQPIADAQEDVQQAFNTVKDSINNSIDILVNDPLTLAFQTTILLQTPALVTQSITARIDAYSNLITQIIDATGSIRVPGNDSQASNAFQNDDLFALTHITGIIDSVINNQFETKTEAIGAADSLLTITDNVINWRDANYESLGEIDTGIAYQKLQNAVALTAGFLIEISFSLKQERSIVLESPTTIINLASELYRAIDDSTLNFIISSNKLTGSEILELPKGKVIVYFV